MGLWLIAKSNIKKKKGNAVILFFLVMLSTLLFYSGFNVLKNIGHFLDENYESQNGAHVVTATVMGYKDQVEGILKNIDGYKKHETEVALGSYNVIGEINKVGSGEKADSMSFMFLKHSQERTISDWTIRDEVDTFEDDSIILPMYLKIAKGIQTGDNISIKFADNTYSFKVAGFVEDVMFSTPSNVSTYKCYISDKMYDNFLQNESALVENEIFSVMLEDVKKSADYEDAMVKKFANEMDEGFSTFYCVNYSVMKIGTSMMINILMAIVAVFSVLIVLTAIVVMRFNIVAAMEENLPNIGILEAVGYTARQLKTTIVIEYMIITFCGIAAGLLSSAPFSNVLTKLISSSIGLDWKAVTDWTVVIITAVIISLMVLTAVLLTARTYNKITTLDALRDGIKTHSFRRNHLPLHKSVFSLNSSLGLKGILHGRKQNFAMILIVSLLSYASVSMLLMYSNFVYNNGALIDLVGIETPDIMISVPAEKLNEVKEELEKDSDVNAVATWGGFGCNITHEENETSVAGDVYDDLSKLRVDTLLEGRRPKWDNEINITNVIAKRLEAEVGDSVTLKVGDTKVNYVVVGITQQISNMGCRATLEEKGLKRLMPAYQFNTLYVYLKDTGKTGDKVTELIGTYESDEEINISNFAEIYDTMLGTFTTSVGGLTVILVIITLAIISLILFLLVRMKLIRERKSTGVFKALGYTTRELMGQTVLSFLPVVAVGVILGSVAAAFSLNKLFALCLSMNGVENCNMDINIWVILITFVVLVLQSLVMVVITSWRIRKIEPYKMITE